MHQRLPKRTYGDGIVRGDLDPGVVGAKAAMMATQRKRRLLELVPARDLRRRHLAHGLA